MLEKVKQRFNTRQLRQANKSGFESQLRPQKPYNLGQVTELLWNTSSLFFVLLCPENAPITSTAKQSKALD